MRQSCFYKKTDKVEWTLSAVWATINIVAFFVFLIPPPTQAVWLSFGFISD